MNQENYSAARRIVNYLADTLLLTTGEQLISQVKIIADFEHHSKSLETEKLISITRLLLDEGVFLASEIIESAQDAEDDMLYVTKTRSLGVFNQLLEGTTIRVIPVEDECQVILLLAIM